MISVICPWYHNADIVKYQLNVWNNYPEELKAQTCFILVDDGSPVTLEMPVVDLNLTLARVKQDIPWNQPGARNLGAYLATTEFLLFTDIDHEITVDALRKALTIEKRRDTVYLFRRVCDGMIINPHPCSFVIHRNVFDGLGGFDEDFSGHRGHDDSMLRSLMERDLKSACINEVLIAHKEAMTTCLERDDRVNTRLLKSKIEAVRNGTYMNGKRLRFDWELVYQKRRGT